MVPNIGTNMTIPLPPSAGMALKSLFIKKQYSKCCQDGKGAAFFISRQKLGKDTPNSAGSRRLSPLIQTPEAGLMQPAPQRPLQPVYQC